MNDGSLPQLVRAAQLLAVVAGGPDAGALLASAIARDGGNAIPAVKDDVHATLFEELAKRHVLNTQGNPLPARAAELVAVAHIVAAVAHSPTAPQRPARLVFSAPTTTMTIGPAERLDLLVLDIIRHATDTLVIGGPFWNAAGLEQLSHVLVPALQHRAVRLTLYLHPPDNPDVAALLQSHIERLTAIGAVDVRWFRKTGYTMLHAKFVAADGRRGYLGSANLTSWGMSEHVEAGVELESAQCQQLLDFLSRLRDGNAFSSVPAGS